MSNKDHAGVTVIVTERVTADYHTIFEEELAGVITALAAMPGNLGVNVIRPEKDRGTYHIIYKFDTSEHLEAWTESEIHVHWRERKSSLTTVPTSVNTLSGLETWFTLPGPMVTAPPPKYKMAIVSWCAIFPIISVLFLTMLPLLSLLPFPLPGAVIAAIAILLMTYLMMPLMTRAFAGWLYPDLPTMIADEEIAASPDV